MEPLQLFEGGWPMKIDKIKISNFGPFLGGHTLELEPDVTVLTGANDVGKSCLLDLLALVCSGANAANHQVNLERAGTADGGLNDRGMCVEIIATVQPGETLGHLPGTPAEVNVRTGDKLTLVRALGPGHHLIATKVLRPGAEQPVFSGPMKPWQVIRLPGQDFRATVPLGQPGDSEAALFRRMFGPDFAQLPSRVPPNWTALVRSEESEISARLRALLPPEMHLGVHLTPAANAIHVSVQDGLGTGVSLDSRGGGVRKIFAILGPLLEAQVAKVPTLVLLDEPENSLHADGQHYLRAFLEQIGRQPLVQVVYATHSPSMINNLREKSVRVIRREKRPEGPTSAIGNLDGGHDNFAPVRSSLGLAPSDSLLYSDLTVVVEGKTEVRCLPILLERLEKDNVEGFAGASALLARAHFFDGEGDSFAFAARFAKSQGGRAIVFIDGDKRQRKGLQKLQTDHPEVPVIRLPSGRDCESLIGADDYLSAVAQEATESGPPVDAGALESLTMKKFEHWLAGQPPWVKEAVFGKRVQAWLESLGRPLSKYAIMQRAAAQCDLTKVRTQELADLVAEMKKLLSRGEPISG